MASSEIQQASLEIERIKQEILIHFEELHQKLDNKRDELLTQIASLQQRQHDDELNYLKQLEQCGYDPVDILSNIKIEWNLSPLLIDLQNIASISTEHIQVYPGKKQVALLNDIENFSTRGLGDIDGIACDSNDQIYLVASVFKSIFVLSQSGEYIRHFGFNVLKDPYGICVDNEFNIYVTDSEMHSLIRFSNSGEMLKMIGKLGKRSGEFSYPRGLASDVKSNIYVVESVVNGRVQVFDPNLNFLRKFGDYELNFCCDVKVSTENFVFVLDNHGSRIIKFNPDGSPLQHAITMIQGNMLQFFALDRYLNLLITDRITNSVKIFTKHLQPVDQLCETNDKTPLQTPRSITGSYSGKIICLCANKLIYTIF